MSKRREEGRTDKIAPIVVILLHVGILIIVVLIASCLFICHITGRPVNPDINTTQTILLTENTNGYLYEIQLSPFCNLVEAEYRCSDSTLEITFQDTEGEIMGKLGSSLQSQKTHFDTPSDHHIIMTVSPHQDDCIITIDEYINKVE